MDQKIFPQRSDMNCVWRGNRPFSEETSSEQKQQTNFSELKASKREKGADPDGVCWKWFN